jgi:hypothetical protein
LVQFSLHNAQSPLWLLTFELEEREKR